MRFRDLLKEIRQRHQVHDVRDEKGLNEAATRVRRQLMTDEITVIGPDGEMRAEDSGSRLYKEMA